MQKWLFAYDKIQHYINEFRKILDADIGKFLSTGREEQSRYLSGI